MCQRFLSQHSGSSRLFMKLRLNHSDNTHAHMCAQTCVYAYTRKCTLCMRMHTHTWTCPCFTQMCTHTHACVHAHTHSRTHTHSHTHTHTHTHVLMYLNPQLFNPVYRLNSRCVPSTCRTQSKVTCFEPKSDIQVCGGGVK